MTVALFDDLSKKAAKLTEKTIEKSSELADIAKTKVIIKSTEADLDKKFIELGKVYYEIICQDNILEQKSASIVQEIDFLKSKLNDLEAELKKEKKNKIGTK